MVVTFPSRSVSYEVAAEALNFQHAQLINNNVLSVFSKAARVPNHSVEVLFQQLNRSIELETRINPGYLKQRASERRLQPQYNELTVWKTSFFSKESTCSCINGSLYTFSSIRTQNFQRFEGMREGISRTYKS